MSFCDERFASLYIIGKVELALPLGRDCLLKGEETVCLYNLKGLRRKRASGLYGNAACF
jgi:hypothetical protein